MTRTTSLWTFLRSRFCPTRVRLAKKWGWDAETQRLALLHVSDPAVRFDAEFEARIRRFARAV